MLKEEARAEEGRDSELKFSVAGIEKKQKSGATRINAVTYNS